MPPRQKKSDGGTEAEAGKDSARLSLSDRVKEHPVYFFAAAIVGGFVAGFTAHIALQTAAAQECMTKGTFKTQKEVDEGYFPRELVSREFVSRADLGRDYVPVGTRCDGCRPAKAIPDHATIRIHGLVGMVAEPQVKVRLNFTCGTQTVSYPALNKPTYPKDFKNALIRLPCLDPRLSVERDGEGLRQEQDVLVVMNGFHKLKFAFDDDEQVGEGAFLLWEVEDGA